ncbi:MAG: hypothetical protein ABR591_06425 [Candidatus Velthaea sp.]
MARIEHRMDVNEAQFETTFVYDFGQVYLYDAAAPLSENADEYVDALDAANASSMSVGIAGPLVDILMPRRENFAAPLSVVVTGGPRPDDFDSWDHVVEFDLDVTSGRLTLEASGGSGIRELALPPERYRARFEGKMLGAAASWNYGDAASPPDAYRLELWPRTDSTPATEIKRWAGYDA